MPSNGVHSAALAPATNNTAAANPAASSSSSLTVTLYFSGRFTLVGAQHELDVYRHFEHISRTLFPFSHNTTKPQQAVDSRQHRPYEAWLEDSRREERTKGGRMGWEDEADRVRHEMHRRERKRAALPPLFEAPASATAANTSTAETALDQQQQQRPRLAGQVRVKVEPGALASVQGQTSDETKESSETAAGQQLAPSARGMPGEHQSRSADLAVSDAAGGQKRVVERKEVEEWSATEPAKLSATAPLNAAVVFVSHEATDKSGDAGDDVEWE